MKFGLILGGGGVVGVAWELGILEGLRQAIGFDAKSADVIVGTSAGAAVGAMATGERLMAELLAQQRETESGESIITPPPPQTGGERVATSVVPEEIMRLITSAGAGTRETAAAIGKLAAEAKVALSEDRLIGYFEGLLRMQAWPRADFRATTIDCETGETVLWGRDDGVDVARAVASSCSIPGYFPPIQIKGRRFTDGPRSPFCASLVQEKGLDGLIFIGPQILLPRGGRTVPEIDNLAAGGLPTVQITGGEGLEALATDLMDPRGRVRAVEVGIEEGRACSPMVAKMLSAA